jgi:hypothetical protein
MDKNGQVYFDESVPDEDAKRLVDAETMEKLRLEAEREQRIMLDRASMREAITAEREARGQAPVRGAEEEIAPVAT